MGSAGPKLEDQEAVDLCQACTLLLADAICHRYALVDAHAANSYSLHSIGAALYTFLHGGLAVPPGSSFSSPPFTSPSMPSDVSSPAMTSSSLMPPPLRPPPTAGSPSPLPLSSHETNVGQPPWVDTGKKKEK